MGELVMVMKEVLAELQCINEKLDEIKGEGFYNSLADIHEKLNEMQGTGTYNTIADVCEKLTQVERSVDSLETTVLSVH